MEMRFIPQVNGLGLCEWCFDNEAVEETSMFGWKLCPKCIADNVVVEV